MASSSSGYKLQKVNEQEVKPIVTSTLKPDEIKGYEVIPMLYTNIFIVGYRGSGKTTALFHIMKECINKDTNVVVFANTHDCDPSWLYMKAWLKKRDQPHIFYSSIMDNKVDILEALLLFLMQKAEVDQERIRGEKEQKKRDKKLSKSRCRLTDTNHDIIVEKKEPVQKVHSPDYFIVLDDMSGEIKTSKSLDRLLKQNRHFKTKVVVSSQDPTDLKPTTKNQSIFWLIFKGFSLIRFKDHIYNFLGLKMPPERVYDIYTSVTKEQGSFLFVDKVTAELRANFNQRIIV